MAGCSTLPSLQGQGSSVALHGDREGTRLGREVANLVTRKESGFRVLWRADEALAARLALIAQAQRTIDLQYYIWAADRTGRQVLWALRAASQRGVRVRLLVDDLNTASVEPLLRGLAGYPNVEVRLFNPFAAGRSSIAARVLASLADFRRIQRRMHNKLLIVDDVVAILGGRNIGDAYLRDSDDAFMDTDVLAAGSIVPEMSDSFDDYWNSDHTYAGGLIWAKGDASRDRADFERSIGDAGSAPEAAGVPGIPHRLQVCPARFFSDPVQKASGVDVAGDGDTIYQRLLELFRVSRREIVVVSPYFVRGRAGVRRIQALVDRGVHVRLLTNSLASTDVAAAYAVYARYRQRLLELGVDMRELRAPAPAPRGSSAGWIGSSAGHLHAKLAVVDGRWLYVGSLNFTRRSERLNTELGLILDCPPLAQEAIRVVEGIPAYRLRAASTPWELEWVDQGEGAEEVWTADPKASLWQRIQAALLSLFVPEGEI